MAAEAAAEAEGAGSGEGQSGEGRRPLREGRGETQGDDAAQGRAHSEAQRRQGSAEGNPRAALGSVVLVGLLFAFVYPTRTFLDQRADTGKARAQLELLRSENAKLAREAKKLQSDTEIERLARAYGLVKPGEQPFVIIPAPSTVPPVTTPTRRERRKPPRRLPPMVASHDDVASSPRCSAVGPLPTSRWSCAAATAGRL